MALTSEGTVAESDSEQRVPDTPLARALVRILDPENRHVGFGLLVAQGKVVTCAHVVAESMDEAPTLEVPPERKRARLEFPFSAPGRVLTAAVVAWRPLAEDGSGDVAGLALDDKVPDGARPIAMARGGGRREHTVLSYGYQNPDSERVPTWVPGTVVGEARPGWLQLGLHEKTGGLRIRRGFSGSPVWDVQNGQVIGLVTQSYLRQDMWLAYATTTDVVLDAWAELRDTFHRASPFRMLVPFESVDRDLFFGRDELATHTVDQILGSEHTLITGASGAGKTSLVRAAVIPGLREHAQKVLTVRLTRDSLWSSVAAALAEHLHPVNGSERMAAEDKLAGELTSAGTAGAVRRLAELLDGDRVVLVIDQFEDILHGGGDFRPELVAELVAELGRLPSVRRAVGGPIVRIVIVMREDKRARLLELPPYSTAPPEEVFVGPLNEQELRAAIEEPVRRSGFVHFEEGLVDLIIDEVHVQPYSLPTLQIVLTELWNRQAADGSLRHSVYQELSQGAGPLATHLERIWHSIGARNRDAARRLFLHLAVPLQGEAFARRVVAQDEVDAEAWSAVDALAGHRLLVLRGTAAGNATAELVHDALIEQWSALTNHLAANRDLLQWRDDLRRQAIAWQQGGRQPGHLLHGAALKQGLAQVRRYDSEVSPREREFVSASRVLRSKRRIQAGLAVGLVTTLLLTLGGFALLQGNAATQNEKDDLSRQLAAQSQTLLDSDPPLAALLAAAAWSTANTPEARYSMLAAQHTPNRATLTGTTGTTHGGAFSPDGRVLATGGGNNDESVRLWDVRSRKLITQLQTGRDTVWNVAFSPDGKRLAAASKFNAVVLVDITTRNTRLLQVPSGSMEDVAFSPDGTLVAGAVWKSGVHVWDAATGEPVIAISPPGGSSRVVFNRTGDRLITTADDGTARFWTLAGKPAGSLGIAAGAEDRGATADAADTDLTGLDLSTDGKMLVTSDKRGRIRLWDMATRKPITGPPRGGNPAFSPDGRLLAFSDGSSIHLWDIAGGQQIGVPLTGHVGAVHGISFSPDGGTLATTSVDTTVRLWDINSYRPSGAPLTVASGKDLGAGQLPGGAASAAEVPGGVERLAFSPDGRTLATGGADLRLWDVATRTSKGPPWAVYQRGDNTRTIAQDVAFSPDGRYLAAVNGGLVDPSYIWDLRGGRSAPRPFVAADGSPLALAALAFAPDGRRLVTADNNGPVRIWETSTLRQLAEIPDEVMNVNDIAVSPDGKLMASADTANLTVRLWDLDQRKVIATIKTGHTDSVYSVAFSPRGSLLASGGFDPAPRLWDSESHLPVGTPPKGHTAGVPALAFSPDGRTLATAGHDRTVRLWDVSTRKQIGQPLTGHKGDISTLAFRPDGKLLASGSRDGTVRFWDVTPTTDLVAAMCGIAGRPLAAAEWQRYTSGQQMPSVCR